MLDERIKEKLVEGYKRLQEEGKLLSMAQLEEAYRTFRSRFGPERLANLGGEALLNLMHAHGNKDSLVYWLEFKDDEEFPDHFGGIGGGSALKFGIFRRKETGSWATADESNNPKDITLEEAIAFAQRHRDELLKGVEVLTKLPPKGTDQDYLNLQEELDRIAPSVSDLAWGHKYFSLIFPEKLDDYHVADLQRFHLLKMMVLPPEGRGRYLCAGRFVAAAAELDIPMNHLTTVLNLVNLANGKKHRYWRVGTSDGTKPRNRWSLMRDENCVAVGWPDVGDLSAFDGSKESREKLRGLMAEKYPSVASQVGNATGQLFSFVQTIQKGDLVLAADGATVLGIARVEGDYHYDASSDFPHRRDVVWLAKEEWKMPNPEGLQTTVREVKKYPENILEVTRRVLETPPKTPTDGPPIHVPIRRLPVIPERINSAVERKGQVILYGPPGTGKTYWAEVAAREIVAVCEFGKTYQELDTKQREVIIGTGKNEGQVRLCCFHPAYGYEDFIEGYRPHSPHGQVVFDLEDGIFKRLCRDAERSSGKRFFLIIDEINRGDIPRIFGELLTILEKDKREKSILLPVSRESFQVPKNVFLIGTMNTADRSISLIDAALRRRFAFIELMPDSSLLGNQSIAGLPLRPWFEALNKRVCEHVGRDARNLQIGHSYLLSGGHPVKDLAAFKKAIQDDIIPLLEEYCYDNPIALENILGKGLFDSRAQRVRHELFDVENEEKLVQALIEPSPEILGSAPALKSMTSEEESSAEEGDSSETDATK